MTVFLHIIIKIIILKNIFFSVFIIALNMIYAQEKKKDTVKLEEVIITATKSKRQLSNVTVPV